jgi:AhpD family alkylhydroperoxidase
VTSARIAPGGRSDVGLLGWIVSSVAGMVAGTEPPNLFLTLGRHRRLFRGWLHFAGRLMPGGVLPRRETELAILRVAHLASCRYEFDHHVRLGRRAGLGQADFDRVVQGLEAPGWTDRERALLTAVDRMHADRDLDDPSWESLRAHLDEREAIELCLLAGHYEMLATTIATLRIQPDRARRRGRSTRRR